MNLPFFHSTNICEHLLCDRHCTRLRGYRRARCGPCLHGIHRCIGKAYIQRDNFTPEYRGNTPPIPLAVGGKYHLISSRVREIQVIRLGLAKGFLSKVHKTHFWIHILGFVIWCAWFTWIIQTIWNVYCCWTQQRTSERMGIRLDETASEHFALTYFWAAEVILY